MNTEYVTMPRMPNQKEGIKYEPKTITLRSDQIKFIEQNSISLSRFVQTKIDELMGVKKAEK